MERVTARRPGALTVAVVLVAAALAAWLVTLDRMAGMDAGPGTDLGRLGSFVGVWVTMMAAMMLPAAAPMVLLFDRVSRRSADTAAFVAGYLAVWTGYGLAAYGAWRLIAALHPAFLAWDRQGPYVAGGALAAAGVYQLTPLKTLCLRHCRSPLHFLFRGRRAGLLGAARMGVAHGAYCAGCCWGLMLALFALGVMSIFWMAAVSAVVFAEKVLPGGERLSRAFALALLALAVWVALAPATVPKLTPPGRAMMRS